MHRDARPDRRLAAIMATDVVGYSSLMQSDEAKALSALATFRRVTTDQIKHHRGRIANTAGDSVLAEFGSAVEAVSCAIALQETLSSESEVRDLQLRIGRGLRIADRVVQFKDDVFSLDIASRPQSLPKTIQEWIGLGLRGEPVDAKNSRRIVSECGNRPRHRRTHQRHEFSPFHAGQYGPDRLAALRADIQIICR